MKEELYKYLSIGLLALLLLVCFGSLITYFVVGQESINTAYALNSSGYFENNLFSIPDATVWSFNFTSTGSEVVFYEDSDWVYSFSGDCSLVNNVFTVNSGSVYVYFKRKNTVSLSTSCLALKFISGSATCQYYNASNGTYNNLSYNSSYGYYYKDSVNNNMSTSGSYLRMLISSTSTLSFIYYSNRSGFVGFVPNSYSPNGYDIGFTDGVNSASGGGGIQSLSGLTWIAPDELITSSSVGHYSINGTYKITSRNGNIYERPFYSLNTYVLASGSNFYHCMDVVCDDWVSPDDSDWDAQIYWINPDDILTFIDGTDIENSTLITFLSDNGSFGAYSDGYTDGYQDGYYQGHVIGYDEGYKKGVTESNITLSGTYNLIGSLLTVGTVSSTINNKTYVAYSSEEESFVADGTRYRGQYYDTQGDPDVYLGLVIDYDFYLSVKINTVLYGLALSQSRWNEVGFKILCVNKNDNSQYFVVNKYDTQYWSYFQTIYSDNVNGLYHFAECTISFPDNDPYTLIFIPEVDPTLRVESNESFDDSSILMFDNTYFLTQGSGSLSYDDYQYLINDAYDRGTQYGRSTGYDSGREVGYNVGYSKGVEDAGNYTFNGLLGAVFDAPITMFIGKYNSETGLREGGLLNFNFLGVNLGAFVIALLSLGLIMFILRLFMRGL